MYYSLIKTKFSQRTKEILVIKHNSSRIKKTDLKTADNSPFPNWNKLYKQVLILSNSGESCNELSMKWTSLDSLWIFVSDTVTKVLVIWTLTQVFHCITMTHQIEHSSCHSTTNYLYILALNKTEVAMKVNFIYQAKY